MIIVFRFTFIIFLRCLFIVFSHELFISFSIANRLSLVAIIEGCFSHYAIFSSIASIFFAAFIEAKRAIEPPYIFTVR
jgi:hypothetical protein